ncbi:hypothetical protein [Sphingomonas sp. SORGH_AS_0879]|uniref:hypothetical protein n=1 Tax=Sphingomonas sp. SORGH_AS_0879 TaxID=3041790 RepID=UPI002788E004|nr:hypothetical protein [Sphingomonas sp. SORGH_AS_0879]MDQ1230615.1 hypothetical protein [Sphingomonas sp. SORGH_AS_0879]
MAYVAFQEIGAARVAVDVAIAQRGASAIRPDARLSALEWQVVALARRDRISSLRAPSKLGRALGSIFGDTRNPRLADPSLEALRRMAVLSWHHGYSVPSHEVRAFLAAGYTPDQYELMVDSIATALSSARRPARLATSE